MQDPVSEAEWYRREADKRAELARSFLGEIHQKVALRYVFMAEELLRGPERDADAIERAVRLDGGGPNPATATRPSGVPSRSVPPRIVSPEAPPTPPRGRLGLVRCLSMRATIFSRIQQSRGAPKPGVSVT